MKKTCFQCSTVHDITKNPALAFCTYCGANLEESWFCIDTYRDTKGIPIACFRFISMENPEQWREKRSRNTTYRFHQVKTIIGRRSGGKRVLSWDIPHTTITSFHAELIFFNRSWYIRDLGSANGTYVNEHIIGDEPIVLQSDDFVDFGGVRYQFTVEYY